MLARTPRRAQIGQRRASTVDEARVFGRARVEASSGIAPRVAARAAVGAMAAVRAGLRAPVRTSVRTSV